MSGILGLPPGLQGWVLGDEQQRQRQAAQMAQLTGILGIQGNLENQAQARQLHPLQLQQLQMQLKNMELVNRIKQEALGDGGTGGSEQALAQGAAQPTPDIGPTNTNAARMTQGGNPLGILGVPKQVQAWQFSGDPGLEKAASAWMELNKPIALREGDLVGRTPQGNFQSMFQQPRMEAGILPERNAGGQVTGSSQIPGYAQAISGIKAGEAGAVATAKAPFEFQNVTLSSGKQVPMSIEQLLASQAGSPPAPPLAPGLAGRPQAEIDAVRKIQSGQAHDVSVPNPALPSTLPLASSLGIGTAEKERLSKAGQMGPELQKQIDDEAQHALEQKRILGEMSQLFQDFSPSAVAPAKKKLLEYAQAAGLPLDQKQLDAVSSMQGISKLNAQLATSAMKQFTNRGTQMEFGTFLKNNPGIEMTPQGATKIIDFMTKGADVSLQKQQEFLQFKNDKPVESWQDFNAVWNKKMNENLGSTLSNGNPEQAPSKGGKRINFKDWK